MCVCGFTGGAGGKGTWGKLTEVYDEDGRTHDTKDPNYDSIEEDVSVLCIIVMVLVLFLIFLSLFSFHLHFAGGVCGYPIFSPHGSGGL